MQFYELQRREFIILLGSAAAAWAPLALAQQPAKLYRILWVSTGSQPDPFLEGFREGLRERGYAEGKNVVLEVRYASGNPDVLRPVASELTHGHVDLVVSSGPAIRALKGATDVPVLFAVSGDPVELGIAESLARPGGNFTGSTFMSRDIAEKRVELLKDTFPQLRTFAVLSNTDHPGERSEWRATQQAAQALGIEPVYVPFTGASELGNALVAASKTRSDAMLVFPEGATLVQRSEIAQFAKAHGLPSMFGWSEYCDAGGLLSYGANQRATYFRLATYADRILHGEKPADLPVEQPTKFELVLNLGTAKMLGINIPPSVQVRADRVIE
jgi:putative tryptophan/tyrosine transport system substrate-binding protein